MVGNFPCVAAPFHSFVTTYGRKLTWLPWETPSAAAWKVCSEHRESLWQRCKSAWAKCRRCGLVIAREQGLRYEAGFAVPVQEHVGEGLLPIGICDLEQLSRMEER